MTTPRKSSEQDQVLIVEDERGFRESLAALLTSKGYRTHEAGTLDEAKAILRRHTIDLVVMDLELPDGRGLDLKVAPELSPSTPFLVVTGDGTAEMARIALRSGAADYLVKPIDPTALDGALRHLHEQRRLGRHIASLQGALRKAGRFGRLVGSSPEMQRVYDHIERVAPSGIPVLITGDNGTGKELTAGSIHDLSTRSTGPFVAINCGAIPATLIESRLFGHEKGAFTGADRRATGVFEQADGGTLFLDEIGEMPAELQVRLLRVLETNEVQRIGGRDSFRVDVRILAATNRDPQAAIAAGSLREDLYHRLAVFPIALPRLEDRRGDVVLLAEHFLEALQGDREGAAQTYAPEALERLASHRYSGNVRQLRNVVQRASLLAGDGAVISAAIIDEAYSVDAPATHENGNGHARILAGADEMPTRGEAAALSSSAPTSQQEPKAPAQSSTATAADSAAPNAEPDDSNDGFVRVPVGSSMQQVEQAMIEATLVYCGGNKRKTSRILGISAKTLYKRLADYEAKAGAATETDAPVGS